MVWPAMAASGSSDGWATLAEVQAAQDPFAVVPGQETDALTHVDTLIRQVRTSR